mmetsp:Transcript_39618/g.64228  ORF Transcript_39618/g.64228 Transcript_39618/m.64228 type:complete len:250 (-) Transcript_39618:3131-3880(-)
MIGFCFASFSWLWDVKMLCRVRQSVGVVGLLRAWETPRQLRRIVPGARLITGFSNSPASVSHFGVRSLCSSSESGGNDGSDDPRPPGPRGSKGHTHHELPGKSPSLLGSDVAQEAIQQVTSQKQYRAGDTYDPLGALFSESVEEISPDYRRRRPRASRPRPQRLVVTGLEIHFTNVWLLSRFLTPLGKIMPRYRTGLSSKKQRKLRTEIKKARRYGLLPYLHRYSHGPLAQAPGEKEPNPLAAPSIEQR